MAKVIAFFVGEHGETAALDEAGKVTLYQKSQGRWQAMRSGDFALGEARGVRELRAGIAEVIGFLGDCKTFVARTVTGLPYFELEKAGCRIWELAGRPGDFLEYVLAKEEKAAQTADPETIPIPEPEDLGNGHYRISIKEIQETDTGITSKQAVQPTLRQGKFSRLEIICNHIPPWLEAEAALGNLACVSEQLSPGKIRVVIGGGKFVNHEPGKN